MFTSLDTYSRVNNPRSTSKQGAIEDWAPINVLEENYKSIIKHLGYYILILSLIKFIP
jgi:hypothetical protein